MFIVFAILLISCGKKVNNCDGAKYMAEKAVKEQLNFPEEAEFDWMSVNCEVDANQYTIMGKFTGKNAFGIKTEFVYKVRCSYISGHELDDTSWDIKSTQLEEIN